MMHSGLLFMLIGFAAGARELICFVPKELKDSKTLTLEVETAVNSYEVAMSGGRTDCCDKITKGCEPGVEMTNGEKKRAMLSQKQASRVKTENKKGTRSQKFSFRKNIKFEVDNEKSVLLKAWEHDNISENDLMGTWEINIQRVATSGNETSPSQSMQMKHTFAKNCVVSLDIDISCYVRNS